MLTATITLRPKGTLQTQTITWFTEKTEPQVVLTERITEPMLHTKRDMNFTMEDDFRCPNCGQIEPWCSGLPLLEMR